MANKKVPFFSLVNLYNQAKHLMIRVSHNETMIEFDVNMVVSKRHKEEINPAIQFELLNKYLDYRGEEFKAKLFEAYRHSRDVMYEHIIHVGADTDNVQAMVAKKMLPPIYDLLKLEEIYDWLTNIYRIKPIEGLKDEFDEKMLRDKDGTREQTYTKDDYRQLVALVMLLKATLGPIGEYGNIEKENISTKLLHYTLFNFYREDAIYQTAPFQKLVGLATKVCESVFKKETSSRFTVADMMVPSDEIPIWALSTALFQKVAVSPIVDDDKARNVITKLHNFVKNKIDKSGDKSGSYADKRHTRGGDDETSESFAESYRIVGDVTPGFEEEMSWAINLLFEDPSELHAGIDKALVDEVYRMLTVSTNKEVSEEQVIVLGWVLSDVIHPQSLIYVNVDDIYKALSVAYAYLYEIGYSYIGMLLTATRVDEDDDVAVVSFTTNRTKITNEIKDELDKLYPYKTVAATTSTERREDNVAVTAVNTVANIFYKNQWILIAPRRHVDEVAMVTSLTISPDPNLKVMLSKMLISLKTIQREKRAGAKAEPIAI